MFHLSDVDMAEEEKAALIGFHAFTGNDYISAFFNKGKNTCWTVLQKNPKFWRVFTKVGVEWLPHGGLVELLEEFVCKLYGCPRLKDINEARFHLFQRTYESKKKIIDLSLLPPCKSSLSLQILRTCYVARIWRPSLTAQLQPPAIENHGWTNECQVKWIEAAFPEDIAMILMNSEFDGNNFEEDSDSSEGSDKEDI